MAETMGAINKDGMDFLGNVGRRVAQSTDDRCDSTFLFQRLSVLIQRYNAVAVWEHDDIMAMCCKSNSTFFIFAVLVVRCGPCRR